MNGNLEILNAWNRCIVDSSYNVTGANTPHLFRTEETEKKNEPEYLGIPFVAWNENGFFGIGSINDVVCFFEHFYLICDFKQDNEK